MTTRSDRITQSQKIPELFSDFLSDFTAHPISGDLARLKNDQAIRQSLKNLILTRYGERLFQPQIGSNIHNALFEFGDITSEEDLKYHITKTIEQNEPRVSLLNLDINSEQDNGRFNVLITFLIINSNTISNIDLILKRIR